MGPNKDTLNRELENPPYQEILNSIGDTLDECINFGTNVLNWCNMKPKNNGADVTLLLLFRHLLEMCDGISVLIRNSCADPAEPLLRSTLESLLSIKYILQNETRKRALSYQVSHIRNRIKSFRMANPNLQEGKNLRNAIKSDSSTSSMDLDSKLHKLDYYEEINNLEELLKKDGFSEVNKEWKRVKILIKRNPNWFALFNGPKTIKDLAYSLNHGAWYEILYRSWSGGIHAADAINNFKVKNQNKGFILGLRLPYNLQTYSNLMLSMSFEAYIDMLQYYDHEKLKDYRVWYINNMREWYLRLSSTEKIIKVE